MPLLLFIIHYPNTIKKEFLCVVLAREDVLDCWNYAGVLVCQGYGETKRHTVAGNAYGD
jgi:hypothetical protein